MTSLINLKKAEHRNNELFVYCFCSCLAYSHLSKVNLPLIPEKKKLMENKNWQRIPTFVSNSAKIHEKSFSLIFVVRVENDQNFGSSNHR